MATLPDEPGTTRSSIEIALVEASHLLVSATQVDLREVLRILGEAVEAESAYLVTAPGEEEFALRNAPHGSVILWHRNGEEAEYRLFATERPSPTPALRLLSTAPDYVPPPPPLPTRCTSRSTPHPSLRTLPAPATPTRY